MNLWCCACDQEVDARLTSGAEVYPHRPDLAKVPRWICDTCNNHVGTHHKTSNPTKPLGNIPSVEIRRARQAIHALIDPSWKAGKIARNSIYRAISDALGYEYHTAEIRTIEEARKVYSVARNLLREKGLIA